MSFIITGAIKIKKYLTITIIEGGVSVLWPENLQKRFYVNVMHKGKFHTKQLCRSGVIKYFVWAKDPPRSTKGLDTFGEASNLVYSDL